MSEWPDWTGEIVACVATGPSLTNEQLQAVRGRARVIAINDAGLPGREPFAADWCDLWYAADLEFWKFHRYKLALSTALRVCGQPEASALVHLHLETRTLIRGAGYAISGGHSGFQALQIAVNSGASGVLLLGYDCRAQAGRTNYFGEKPNQLYKASPYTEWLQPYRTLKPRCHVINCTPGSAIDAFPFQDIEEVFAEVA